jgi:hypothetical protein
MQKSVMREVLRPFQRPRFVMQQRAAAHWNHLLAEQSDRPLRHRFGLAIADGEIDEASFKIEHVGRRRDPHVDIGVKRGEATEPWNEPERSESRRCGNGQLACAAFGSESVNRDLQPIERVGRNPVERLPVLGQCQRPWPPLKQLQAEIVLKRLNLPAHGGLSNEELLGCLGEAQRARRGLEALEEG